METITWLKGSLPFIHFVDAWYGSLPDPPLQEVVADPGRVAIVSVDVINGFCHIGPLASDRVKRIIDPIVRLFRASWELGVRNIVLVHDTHEPEAVEFGQFPPHCVRGTEEAEAVPEFKSLPFYDQMSVFEKNSIHSGLNTGLNEWIAAHPEVDRYLIVGDCTDLCTYQLAMHLRLDANARQIERRVLVPIDCVDTYDMPVSTANQIGAVPHDAELLHRIFLYSMMLNGVEVIASLTGPD